jgi:hypothetical protein
MRVKLKESDMTLPPHELRGGAKNNEAKLGNHIPGENETTDVL